MSRAVELLAGRALVALTGAGCSTGSGIPDYRGEGRAPRRASIQGPEFARDPRVRRRYWARALVGWERLAAARPNPAHRALAAMEGGGALTGLITQNVDGLHQAAGSRQVVELHGALSRVVCLRCGARAARDEVQRRLRDANPGFVDGATAPDGDADVPDALVERVRVVDCDACGGPYKPDVVFFGDPVPRSRVERAYGWVDAASALLVAGTSLQVFSGLRFLRRAAERGAVIVVANRGPVRGEEAATLRLDGDVGELLPALADALTARAPHVASRAATARATFDGDAPVVSTTTSAAAYSGAR